MIIKGNEALADGVFTPICGKMKPKADISLNQKPSLSIPPDCITLQSSEFGLCITMACSMGMIC